MAFPGASLKRLPAPRALSQILFISLTSPNLIISRPPFIYTKTPISHITNYQNRKMVGVTILYCPGTSSQKNIFMISEARLFRHLTSHGRAACTRLQYLFMCAGVITWKNQTVIRFWEWIIMRRQLIISGTGSQSAIGFLFSAMTCHGVLNI